MGQYLKTDVPGYVRDENTGTIINTNEHEFMRYSREKNVVAQQKLMDQKVNQLADTVSEMRELLKLLVNKQNGS